MIRNFVGIHLDLLETVDAPTPVSSTDDVSWRPPFEGAIARLQSINQHQERCTAMTQGLMMRNDEARFAEKQVEGEVLQPVVLVASRIDRERAILQNGPGPTRPECGSWVGPRRQEQSRC